MTHVSEKRELSVETVLLQADNRSKIFGTQKAVDDLSLAVKKGEILGFLGPNGAGKTTTMKMLTGYLRPTSGSVRVAGSDILSGGAALRRQIGYLPEGAPLYPEMTVSEYLHFIAQAHSIEAAACDHAVMSAAKAVHLTDVMQQHLYTLSKGYARRVGLAGAILHRPDILILDEPTDGLDPNQKHEVRQLIETMSMDRAIIISTHILEEVETLCTRAIIINQGRIVADALPTELKAQSRYNNAVTMLVDTEAAEKIAGTLVQMSSVENVDAIREGDLKRLTVFSVDQQEIASQISDMAEISRWPVHQIYVENGRLDDVFRRLTTSEVRLVKGEDNA